MPPSALPLPVVTVPSAIQFTSLLHQNGMPFWTFTTVSELFWKNGREEVTGLGHYETTCLSSIDKFSRVLLPGGHWHYLPFGNSDTFLFGKALLFVVHCLAASNSVSDIVNSPLGETVLSQWPPVERHSPEYCKVITWLIINNTPIWELASGARSPCLPSFQSSRNPY